MLFGQIGFHCPVDGMMQVGFDCVEDMVVHQQGSADIAVRCPKCGTLVKISSQTPIIPRAVVEQLARDLHIPLKDGKFSFSNVLGRMTGQHGIDQIGDSCSSDCDCSDTPLLSSRDLTDTEDKQLEYFAFELDQMESVDEFLARTVTDADEH
ncbi:MAG: hypothetical protein FWC81_01510 [Coriobacteriia bacterium]|nr:hypothetical protein [Coriobacteriia bacterium]MCL2606101.1 hypothetical protein [Coriobacteriia bacterium]